jgi:DNA-binding transcriptional MerR regulator
MFKIGEFAQLAQVTPRQLRNYDQLGLLRPVRIDPQTDYRYYSIRQLPRLNCILALKALGFALEQIGPLLNNEVSAEALRGMLATKRSELAQSLREEEARLRHIESRIEQLDGHGEMRDYDVVMKSMPATPFLSLQARCNGLDDAIALFQAVTPDAYRQVGADVRDKLIVIARNNFHQDDIDLEIGFSLTRPSLAPVTLVTGHTMACRELPAAGQMATIVRSGSKYDSHKAFAAIGWWIEVHGYEIAGPCREVFVEQLPAPPDPHDALVEIQLPIRAAAAAFAPSP